MQVDGPKIPFDVSLAGRRSPQLVARLSELSDALTSAGIKQSPYDRVFEGFNAEVPVDNSVLPELEPYRSLDFNRLRVVGEGHFDPFPTWMTTCVWLTATLIVSFTLLCLLKMIFPVFGILLTKWWA